MAEAGSTQLFCGSVNWGYKTKDGTAELEPTVLSLANFGEASPEFFAAVGKWNEAEYHQFMDDSGPKFKGMSLPAPFLTQLTAMVKDLEVSTSGELIERLGFSL